MRVDMLNLSAFTGKDLQNITALIETAMVKSVAELQQVVKKELARRKSAQDNQPAEQVSPCKSCGALTVPVINGEGLNIMGCKSCGYSEIIK